MTFPLRPLARLVLTVTALASCKSSAPAIPAVLPPPTLPAPSVSSQWVAIQSTVLAFVSENRPAAADSSLGDFARAFPRTPEGDRARWWRTLMRAESRTTTSGDAGAALAQIDSLLADSIAIEVRAEAVLMRRSIGAVDSLRKAEVRRRVQATQLASDRADELKTARDSMVKLSAEIGRLRRRLSAP